MIFCFALYDEKDTENWKTNEMMKKEKNRYWNCVYSMYIVVNMSLALRVCVIIVCGERLSELSYYPVDSSSQNEHSGWCDVAAKCVFVVDDCLAVVEKRASLFRFPCVYVQCACMCACVWRCGRIDSAYTVHTIQQTHAHTSCLEHKHTHRRAAKVK